MDTNHNHQWVFGKGFKICDRCAKVEIGRKKVQDKNQVLMVMH